MAIESNGAAPYAPASAVVEIIQRYRDRGLETPFTNDVLSRAGVTDSLAPRTLQALKLLDFIDDSGNPTEGFESLAKVPSDEYQAQLTGMIEAAYEPIFRFANPRIDTVERVEDAFRRCTPKGQRGRMVTLFYGLCEEAGMISESPTRKPDTSASSSASRSRPTASKPPHNGSNGKPKDQAPRLSGLPAPLAGMIQALPTEWDSQQARDDWLALFTATLDYSIKVKSAESSGFTGQEVSA